MNYEIRNIFLCNVINKIMFLFISKKNVNF